MRCSVIIPTSNRADCIGRTLDSVLAQTVAADEVIVIDHGSTADTATLVAPYGARVRYVRQASGGVVAARNHGARLAGGRWLAFVDSDDLWHERKLERQLAVLDHVPEARWSRTGCNVIGLDDADIPGRGGFEAVFHVCDPEAERAKAIFARYLEPRHVEVSREPVLLFTGNAYDALFLGNFGLPSSAVIERSLFAGAGGFNPEFRVAEDTELFHRLAASVPVAILVPALVGYRVGRAGVLSSPANSVLLIENALRSVDGAHELRPAADRSIAHWQGGRRRLLARRAYTRLSNLDLS